ncbi:MAG TPA: hypothetical protein VGE47_01250 [Burkholderiaceae bacterium]
MLYMIDFDGTSTLPQPDQFGIKLAGDQLTRAAANAERFANAA